MLEWNAAAISVSAHHIVVIANVVWAAGTDRISPTENCHGVVYSVISRCVAFSHSRRRTHRGQCGPI